MGLDFSVRGIMNGALDLADKVNVFTSEMDNKKEDMIDLLMENNYSKDDILDLIDVVREQASSYIDKRVEYEEWAKKEAVKKPRTSYGA